ncbi:tail protein [Roseibium aquae]|uniref:Tail protein n=2 Tax=Roseibium aquae TaxID=1323746 RepID=A0A916TLH7_9HYPH|nr:phage tail tape measure protein [Roseibium aquae]GGB51008.1 tail protein [Roseibium aquae]
MPDNEQLNFPDLEPFHRQMTEINRQAQTFSLTLTQGLKAAVVHGKDLDAVFRQMALSISSKVLTRSLAPLEQAAGSLFGDLVSGLAGQGARGAATLVQSLPVPFAKGGVVAAPSYFPLDGGLGLMGEAGPEAILPLSRGADGRLGVQTQRAGANAPPVQVTVIAQDVESFRRSEAQVSAMVARAVGRGRRGL